MKTKKKGNRHILKLSKKVAPQLEVFKQYSQMTGISLDDLLDKALDEYLDEVAGKKGRA